MTPRERAVEVLRRAPAQATAGCSPGGVDITAETWVQMLEDADLAVVEAGETQIGLAEVGAHADPDVVPHDELRELLLRAVEQHAGYRRDQLHHVSHLPYMTRDGRRGSQIIAWVASGSALTVDQRAHQVASDRRAEP